MFNFPDPTPADIDEAKRAVERFYTRDRRRWSEIAGAYASVRLKLLTPTWGIVDTTLSSIGISGTASINVVLLVRKDDESWSVIIDR